MTTGIPRGAPHRPSRRLIVVGTICGALIALLGWAGLRPRERGPESPPSDVRVSYDDPRAPLLSGALARAKEGPTPTDVLAVACVDEKGNPRDAFAWIQLPEGGRLRFARTPDSADAGRLESTQPMPHGSWVVGAVDRETGDERVGEVVHDGVQVHQIVLPIRRRQLDVVVVDESGRELASPVRVTQSSVAERSTDPLFTSFEASARGLERIAAADVDPPLGPFAKATLSARERAIEGPRFELSIPVGAATRLSLWVEGRAPWSRWVGAGDSRLSVVAVMTELKPQTLRVLLGGKAVGLGYRVQGYAARLTRSDWGGATDDSGRVRISEFPESGLPVFFLYRDGESLPVSWASPAADARRLPAFFEHVRTADGADVEFPAGIGGEETWTVKVEPSSAASVRSWLTWGGGVDASRHSTVLVVPGTLRPAGGTTATGPAFLFRPPFECRLDAPDAAVRLRADESRRVLSARTRAIEGDVVNASGVGIAGAFVSWASDADSASYLTRRRERATTDELGRFSIRVAETSSGTLVVEAAGARTVSAPVRAADSRRLRIMVTPLGYARLRLIGADAASGARLRLGGNGLDSVSVAPDAAGVVDIPLGEGEGTYDLSLHEGDEFEADLGSLQLREGDVLTLEVPRGERRSFRATTDLLASVLEVTWKDPGTSALARAYAAIGPEAGVIRLPLGDSVVQARVAAGGGVVGRPGTSRAVEWSWTGKASDFPTVIGSEPLAGWIVFEGAARSVTLHLQGDGDDRVFEVPAKSRRRVRAPAAAAGFHLEPAGGVGRAFLGGTLEIDLGRELVEATLDLAPEIRALVSAAGVYTVRRVSGPRVGEIIATERSNSLLALRGSQEDVVLRIAGSEEERPARIRVEAERVWLESR